MCASSVNALYSPRYTVLNTLSRKKKKKEKKLRTIVPVSRGRDRHEKKNVVASLPDPLSPSKYELKKRK